MPLLGTDLQFLAAISELSRLDLESASIGLIADQKTHTLTARYRSPYALGERWIETYDGPSLMCEINAERFKALAGLFPNQQAVTLGLRDQTLVIDGKGTGSEGRRKLDMQIQRDEVDEPPSLDEVEADIALKVSTDTLRDEFELARDYCAKNYAQPILTGVNFEINGKRVVMSAWDTYSLFTSTLAPVGRHKTDSANATVPELDFELGLKVLGTGEADLEVVFAEQQDGMLPSRIRVRTAQARFSCTPLIGDWPDLSVVSRDVAYQTSLHVPGRALSDAVTGVKALNPNYAKSGIEIATDTNGLLAIRTKKAEHGQLVLRPLRERQEPDVLLSYSVASMALAAKLGDQLTFEIPKNSKAPTHIVCGERQCWISPTVG